MAWINTERRGLARYPETYTARPVFARTVEGMMERALYLYGWRYLRCISSQVCWAPYSTSTPNIPANDEVHVRWTTSAAARYVWVAFRYYLDDTSTGSPPQVDITLETPAGAALDAGIRCTVANGLLLADQRHPPDPTATGPENNYADHTIFHTGFTPRDAVVVQTEERRLLNINSGGGANTDVVCKLDCQQVRILDVTVWEAHREEI